MALIRYPGSKEKIAPAIWATFPDEMKHELWSESHRWEYREPFFGAGAVGFRVLRNLSFRCGIWINDADYGIASLWSSVRHHVKELLARIGEFEPSVEAFDLFKREDGEPLDEIEAGFRKLALHRISFSGLGVMAGGPIGGTDQHNAQYKVGCRWRPERLKRDAVVLHKLLRKFAAFRITCGDFAQALSSAGERTFVYLDPPYYEKGPSLYRHAMSDDDHERLAASLRDASFHWVLSYDDHPRIRELYHWATIKPIHITYTTAIARNGERRKNQEILITV